MIQTIKCNVTIMRIYAYVIYVIMRKKLLLLLRNHMFFHILWSLSCNNSLTTPAFSLHSDNHLVHKSLHARGTVCLDPLKIVLLWLIRPLTCIVWLTLPQRTTQPIFRELPMGGGLTLTWYTYMCLPFGRFFAKFCIQIGGFPSGLKEPKFKNWVYFENLTADVQRSRWWRHGRCRPVRPLSTDHCQ